MSVLSCSFILLLILLPVICEAKHPHHEGKPDKPHPPQTLRPRPVPAYGRLTTRGGHQCTWRTSGRVLVTLLVNCSTETPAANHRYWCRYSGEPGLCRAVGVTTGRYWKQLMAKVRKRSNACEGEEVLRVKTCRRGPPEAHMTLTQRGGEEEQEEGDAAALQSYCSDGWSSVCSFFIKMFEG
ncbi:fibroblast growth factor-binding protein 2 [Antennarius striatus]|uniref:fibroblast growth factor-binding protein 2 n=1 Tax=Antennarius striatus TaxID=241820 RepID=UPI0035B3655A